MNTTKVRWLVPLASIASLVMMCALSAPLAAQQQTYGSQAVSANDIQQLQNDVYSASTDVSALRSRDRALADRLQNQLDDLRDDVTYLKVKLRREGSVSQSDYADVRDRIQDVRAQARGEARPAGAAPSNSPSWTTNSGAASGGSSGSGYYGGTQDATAPQRQARPGEVPAGQELDVRLESELSSATAQVEDRFRATTVVDLYQGNDVLIPAGSALRGVVSSVDRATRTDRKGSMTLAFDQITIRGRDARSNRRSNRKGAKGTPERSARAPEWGRSSAAFSAAPRARCSAS